MNHMVDGGPLAVRLPNLSFLVTVRLGHLVPSETPGRQTREIKVYTYFEDASYNERYVTVPQPKTILMPNPKPLVVLRRFKQRRWIFRWRRELLIDEALLKNRIVPIGQAGYPFQVITAKGFPDETVWNVQRIREMQEFGRKRYLECETEAWLVDQATSREA